MVNDVKYDVSDAKTWFLLVGLSFQFVCHVWGDSAGADF